ncbi:MAG: Uma2 family endonuclease [Phormidium tanganyikae FI6-MK23]|jgi:Uma2 family endonuclease|nr:Uma2 family endonuclease [Phormidium tanganyikae FI6-MK23]
MTLTSKLMTLAEYLEYDAGTEKRYELVDGVLIEMPPESTRNTRIALFLLSEFLKLLPFQKISHKDYELVVSGARTRVRFPDLMVFTDELVEALSGATRGTILLDMPPPEIVVEVVSPGKPNRALLRRYRKGRDYRYKRSEYAARGIAEYWVIDPDEAQITLLTLVDGFYEAVVLRGSDRIQSAQLPELQLTIEQVMQAGE